MNDNEEINPPLKFTIRITHKSVYDNPDFDFWNRYLNQYTDINRDDRERFEKKLRFRFGLNLALIALFYKGISTDNQANSKIWPKLNIYFDDYHEGEKFALKSLGFYFNVQKFSYGSLNIDLGIVGSIKEFIKFFNENIDFFNEFLITSVPLALDLTYGFDDTQQYINVETFFSSILTRSFLPDHQQTNPVTSTRTKKWQMFFDNLHRTYVFPMLLIFLAAFLGVDILYKAYELVNHELDRLSIREKQIDDQALVLQTNSKMRVKEIEGTTIELIKLLQQSHFDRNTEKLPVCCSIPVINQISCQSKQKPATSSSNKQSHDKTCSK